MKYFRVDLRGENFLLNLDGEPRKFGFHLRRYLRALDAGLAEKTASIQTRQIPALKQGVCNTRENPPRILLQQMREINPFVFALRHKKIHFELLPEEELL